MKHLIVNADDFGVTTGVNEGIAEAHVDGVVTSASLVVTAPAARDAAERALALPDLSIGLHWTGDGEYGPTVDLGDSNAVEAEIDRQLEAFVDLVGAPPTHVDSHHHVHLEEQVMPIFIRRFSGQGTPVRGDGRVALVGGFYAQWEWRVTNLEYVSVDFLLELFEREVYDGWTELSCHPGRVTAELHSVYRDEREAELSTLTDAKVRAALDTFAIELASYRDLEA
jgi:predicted glycoside hydrolase/deacetylase ChbG (UPF0249 family)